MSVTVLGRDDVVALLPMRACIDVMAETFATLARGEAVQPLRSLMRLSDGRGLLGLMPGQLAAPAALGIKVVSVMPGNHGTPYESHQGAVLVFEPEHGALVGVVDATAITAIRTAAVSGLATMLLARHEAMPLAMLGSGAQADAHLDAMLAVREVREVRVWSRDAARARGFAERGAARHGVRIEVASSARAAVEGAGLVCTVTGARTPVLEGAWLSPGTHVNAVGACFPEARELDTAAVARARLFVDRRESALAESGDVRIPIAEGAFDERHILGEIGDLVLRRLSGRTAATDVTLFKSLGLAVEDLAAAHHVLEAARSAGRGTTLALGGTRDA